MFVPASLRQYNAAVVLYLRPNVMSNFLAVHVAETSLVTGFVWDKFVVVEFIDNGPGMDRETSKRVFEPFFTTKEVGTGTGLGLAVSYFIIVNNHKGSIEIDSEKGKGARFIISIPFQRNR